MRSFNENWEAEMAAFDKECAKANSEYSSRHITISGEGSENLTDEENEVLRLYLSGMSFEAIAEQAEVEVDLIAGLMEIIRAKLSLTD